VPAVTEDLADDLHARRALVETYLPRALDLASGAPASLREAMAYSLLAPGKRLRPLLVLLACEAAGGGACALPAAAAVEMVHTYSLIHDDLPAMDDDDLRRGRPTCHKQFGEALAILAGDALLTLAFQVLAESYPPATAAACCRELARGAGAGGMVGGQVEDLAWEQGSGVRGQESGVSNQGSGVSGGASGSSLTPDSCSLTPGLADLERVHAQKTGALFRACLRIGGYVARGEQPGGPGPDVLEALDVFGRGFGLAFQITDDLLDVHGQADRAGKRVGKDAARGKLTYPGLLGAAESRRRAAEQCRQAADALRPLGPAGARLAALAQSILNRDR
jgi:geranylgeranyl diphosphate synthase type II